MELEPFEINALAMQYCGVDPSAVLTVGERKQVEDAEKHIRLYFLRTSIQTRYTLAQQAEALGVSVATIKRMAKSEDFQKVVGFMAPPSRSPIVDAAKEYLQTNLLPVALDTAFGMLRDPDVGDTAKVSLIREILRTGLADTDTADYQTRRQSAMDFLRQQGIGLEQVNIVIQNNLAPKEYVEKLQEVVDGEVTLVDDR